MIDLAPQPAAAGNDVGVLYQQGRADRDLEKFLQDADQRQRARETAQKPAVSQQQAGAASPPAQRPGNPPTAVHEGVVSGIIGSERGATADARNPRSSAMGDGQFIDGTWLSMMRKYRSDLTRGRGDDEILAMRADRQLSREMTARYADENTATLRAAGLPVTNGTTYLAHFLGPGGAQSVLKASADAPAESVIDPAAIKANPFLAGKTAGWVRNWADQKMAAPGETDDWLRRNVRRVGGDVLQGIKEAPAAAAGGLVKGWGEFAKTLNGVGDWLNEHVADLRVSIPKTGSETVDALLADPLKLGGDILASAGDAISSPQSVTGNAIKAIGQFVAGFQAAGVALKAIGMAPKVAQLGHFGEAAVKGGIADFAAFDALDQNLSNLVQEVPALQNPVTEMLATDPADPEWMNRGRRAIEGLGLGALQEGLLQGTKAIAQWQRIRANAPKATGEGDAAAAATAAPDEASLIRAAEQGRADAAQRDWLILGDPDAPLTETRKVETPPGAMRSEMASVSDGDAAAAAQRIRDGGAPPLGTDQASKEKAQWSPPSTEAVWSVPHDDPGLFVRSETGNFLKGPQGTASIGEVLPFDGAPHAETTEIRIRRGDIDHVDTPAKRRDAQQAGYQDGLALTLDVTQNWTQVRQGDRANRLVLAKPNGLTATAVVELERDNEGFYRVVTAGMRAPDKLDATAPKLWQRPPTTSTPAVGEQVPHNPSPQNADAAQVSSSGQSTASLPPAGEADNAAANVATQPQGGSWVGDIWLNFARIDTTDDVKAAVAQLVDAKAADINAARRGTRSHADTAAAAAQQDAFKILMERRAAGGGTPLSAEQSLAVRQLWTASTEKLIEVSKLAAANPSEGNLFAFRKMLATHNMIQREAIAARTETARALESWKIPASAGGRERLRSIEALLRDSGGASLHRAIAERVAVLAENPAALEAFAEKAPQATTLDAIREYWVNALLSAPSTHVVNTLSNASVVAQQIYERWTAEQISAFRGGSGVAPGEAAAMVNGLVGGWRDALKLSAKALWSGQPEGLPGGKLDIRQRAISAETWGITNTTIGRAVDYFGAAVNLPARFLGAEDEMFGSLGYRMQVNALAVRQAVQEGTTGAAFRKRVAELIADPPETMRLEAVDQALYSTFADRPGAFAEGLIRLREKAKLTTFVLPFIKTPAHVLSYALERSPMAPLVKTWREDLAAGGARADLALARMATGTMIMLTAADLVDRGLVSGAGPSDRGQQRNLLQQGWQPYSIRLGDKWVSYNRLDPLGMTLGIAANLAEVAHDRDIEAAEAPEVSEVAGALVAAVASSTVDKVYLQGLANVVQALDDPKRFGARYVEGLAGSFIPAGAAAVERAVDPWRRDTNGMFDYLQSRIAGLSDSLPAARDRWGHPIPTASGLGWGFDALTPARVSQVRPSPIDAELDRMGVSINQPSKKTTFGGIPVDFRHWPEVWDEYRRLAGHALNRPPWNKGAEGLLNDVVTGKHALSASYRLRPDGDEAGSKGEWIRGVIADFRSAAANKILTDPQYATRFADFRAFVAGEKAAQRQARIQAITGAQQ